jgi:hypothetical protein
MSNYYSSQQPQYPQGGAPTAAQNLQFFPSQYTTTSGTPQQQGAAGGYGYAASTGGYGVGAPAQNFANPASFGAQAGVSGRMGEQGGLRTGWVAAFSSEGYDGEPPLLEELGVNFGHIQAKVNTTNVTLYVKC